MEQPRLTIEVKGKFGTGRTTMAIMLKNFLKAKGFTVELEDIDYTPVCENNREHKEIALQGHSNNVVIRTIQLPRSREDIAMEQVDGGF